MVEPIYWESLCGNSSPFWDYQTIWNATSPDFPECFQKTVLTWVPCAFLWILIPLEVYFILLSNFKSISWTLLNATKLALCFCLILLDIIRNGTSVSTSTLDIYSIIFRACTMKLVMTIIYAERRHGIMASSILLWFWFLFCSTQAIILWSYFKKVTDQVTQINMSEYVITVTYFSVAVAQLILACVTDAKPQYTKVPLNAQPQLSKEESASVLSKLFFIWFDKLALLGYRRALKLEDFGRLNYENKSIVPIQKFNKKLKAVLRKQGLDHHPNQIQYSPVNTNLHFSASSETIKEEKPFLFRTTIKVFGPSLIAAIILKITADILSFSSPLILGKLIEFVSSRDQPLWHGMLCACFLPLATFMEAVVTSRCMQSITLLSLNVRSALMNFIYRKALRLSSKARAKTTVGQIVNIMSVDIQRTITCIELSVFAISTPFQLVIAMVELWSYLGPSSAVCLAVIIIFQAITIYIIRKSKALQVIFMKLKDQRIKILNEILNGVKVLKSFAWEVAFSEYINVFRLKELNALRKIFLLNSVIAIIWGSSSFTIALFTFTAFVLFGNNINASNAFVSITVFNILRRPLMQLPNLIASLVEGSVSLKRINDFSLADEIDPTVVEWTESGENAVQVENGRFSWADNENMTLTDINIAIKEGLLVAIVGPVGSGKSSLISGILGEMTTVQGSVTIKGSAATTSQLPWIQNGTLKHNVLFGNPFDDVKYRNVLEACGLLPDIEILPAGDMTEIGEKGINLSGGQKQRLSLARALYANASVYFLDDPLSAVDAHVGKHIFEKVIGPSGLLGGKTRILVTHSLTYLPQTDLVIVVSNGRITEMGPYQELLSRQGAFAEFVTTFATNNNTTETVEDRISQIDAAVQRPGYKRSRQKQAVSKYSDDTVANKEAVEKGVLIKAETVQTGKVKRKIYIEYLKAYGFCALVMLCSLAVGQACLAGSTVWMSVWANDKPLPDGSQNIPLRDMRLGVYGALGSTYVLLFFVFFYAMISGAARASSSFHSRMLGNVLHAPQWYFDTTPIGRILNCFSSDINTVDIQLPQQMRLWLNWVFQTGAGFVVIIAQIPWLALIALPIVVLFYLLQTFSIASGRQIRRLVSTTRSPIYSVFSESVAGATTIRAFKCEELFLQDLISKIDDNVLCSIMSFVAERWLIIRMEFLASILLFCASAFAVLWSDDYSPGTIGLVVSYTITITTNLKVLFRSHSLVETLIVSVERVMEFDNIPQEAVWVNPHSGIKANWPSDGSITFESYETKYRKELDTVLKGINCTVLPREKVGIVGRTGSGKSSLTLAVLRILEPVEGRITIDGFDISKIGLHELRSQITIIPQDPVLFSGTVRMNLDPFDAHKDEDLWKAVEHAHLKQFISSLPDGLSHNISEGGENLSVGQRQLMCLARALLRKNKILMLDEATASVDLETDTLIQATIRQEFADCTVLTIAHRLNTILDCDRVLVLGKGHIEEFDSPTNLLRNKNCAFYRMAKDAGFVS